MRTLFVDFLSFGSGETAHREVRVYTAQKKRMIKRKWEEAHGIQQKLVKTIYALPKFYCCYYIIACLCCL